MEPPRSVRRKGAWDCLGGGAASSTKPRVGIALSEALLPTPPRALVPLQLSVGRTAYP